VPASWAWTARAVQKPVSRNKATKSPVARVTRSPVAITCTVVWERVSRLNEYLCIG